MKYFITSVAKLRKKAVIKRAILKNWRCYIKKQTRQLEIQRLPGINVAKICIISEYCKFFETSRRVSLLQAATYFCILLAEKSSSNSLYFILIVSFWLQKYKTLTRIRLFGVVFSVPWVGVPTEASYGFPLFANDYLGVEVQKTSEILKENLFFFSFPSASTFGEAKVRKKRLPTCWI